MNVHNEIQHLKSGEVNLGVLIHFTIQDTECPRLLPDLNYGRPVQGRGHHWCRQPNDNRKLHRTITPFELHLSF